MISMLQIIPTYHRGSRQWLIRVGTELLHDDDGNLIRFDSEEAAQRIVNDGPRLKDFLTQRLLH